jgi:hypothetical protein
MKSRSEAKDMRGRDPMRVWALAGSTWYITENPSTGVTP